MIDTSVLFRKPDSGKKRKLKEIVDKLLGLQIQTGVHSPYQDACSIMKLILTKLELGPDWDIYE